MIQWFCNRKIACGNDYSFVEYSQIRSDDANVGTSNK